MNPALVLLGPPLPYTILKTDLYYFFQIGQTRSKFGRAQEASEAATRRRNFCRRKKNESLNFLVFVVPSRKSKQLQAEKNVTSEL